MGIPILIYFKIFYDFLILNYNIQKGNTEEDLKEDENREITTIPLKQTNIAIMERAECADFLNTRQLCAGIPKPVVHDTCQVRLNKMILY
jgi:hypothetical protein